MSRHRDQLSPRRAKHARTGLLVLRAKFGSQGALAERLGISQQAVSKALGKAGPSAAVALRVADVLGVYLNELIDEGRVSPIEGRKGAAALVCLRDLAEWPDVLQRAIEMSRGNPPRWCLEAAGQILVPFRPSQLTPLYVLKLADALYTGGLIDDAELDEPPPRSE